MNVVVMFGGRSVEHDISIISALQAMEHFRADSYTVYPVYITRDNEFMWGEELKNIKSFTHSDELLKHCERVVFTKDEGKVEMVSFPMKAENPIICTVDVVFPIVHGTNVEDGILQGYLKTLDVPFVGCDVLSSAIGMDKYYMKVLLEAEGFPVLPGKRYSFSQYQSYEELAAQIQSSFNYPIIVKPVNLGSSIGVSKVSSHKELLNALMIAHRYTSKILIERAVIDLKEVNCSVLGDPDNCLVSECEEPVTSHDVLDFEEKYISGNKNGGSKGGSKGMASLKRKIPAEIDTEMKQTVQEISRSVFQFLECNGVIRIDYLIDKNTNCVWLNEINTIPGSLSFYLWEATGITYEELIDRLIALALRRYEDEKNIEYSFKSSVIGQLSSKG